MNDIDQAVQNLKNVLGNDLFDKAKGTIEGALENSGVEIKNPAVPVAKQDTNNSFNYSKLLIPVGILGAAFLYFKTRSKGRV